jgi:hypothetical protein
MDLGVSFAWVDRSNRLSIKMVLPYTFLEKTS